MARSKVNLVRVELVNRQTIGARAGYGEGRTVEAAVQNALNRLSERERATATVHGRQVWFDGGVNC